MIPIRGLRALVASEPRAAEPVVRARTNRGPRVVWTEDMDAILRRMWAAGVTGTRIAAEMPGSLTRSAVIARANRLRLARRANPVGGA